MAVAMPLLCYVTYVTLTSMAIGKSRRIVIDVEDVALKRSLYAVLAAEGRSLKDWFAAAVSDYLSLHSREGAARPGMRVAERTARYHAQAKQRKA